METSIQYRKTETFVVLKTSSEVELMETHREKYFHRLIPPLKTSSEVDLRELVLTLKTS